VEIWLHVFLTSAIIDSDFSNLSSSPFISGGAAPSIHYIEGWVSPEPVRNIRREEKVVPVEKPQIFGYHSIAYALY